MDGSLDTTLTTPVASVSSRIPLDPPTARRNESGDHTTAPAPFREVGVTAPLAISMIHTLLPAPLRWMLNAEYFSSGESLADTYSAGSPTVPRSFPSPPRQVSRDFPMKVPARYASTPAAGALNAARQFPSFSVYAADATVGLRASRR